MRPETKRAKVKRQIDICHEIQAGRARVYGSNTGLKLNSPNFMTKRYTGCSPHTIDEIGDSYVTASVVCTTKRCLLIWKFPKACKGPFTLAIFAAILAAKMSV